jgi:hypothetical protein
MSFKRNIMKKLLVMLFCSILALTISACGGGGGGDGLSSDSPSVDNSENFSTYSESLGYTGDEVIFGNDLIQNGEWQAWLTEDVSGTGNSFVHYASIAPNIYFDDFQYREYSFDVDGLGFSGSWKFGGIYGVSKDGKVLTTESHSTIKTYTIIFIDDDCYGVEESGTSDIYELCHITD